MLTVFCRHFPASVPVFSSMCFFNVITMLHTSHLKEKSIQKWPKIEGNADRLNDVLTLQPATPTGPNIVYFGGDIQDYYENMVTNSGMKYSKWSLENTIKILGKRFPDSPIFVITPDRMHMNTFSVYNNFMNSDDFGNPNHTSDYGGTEHLRKLLASVKAGINHNEGQGTCDKTNISCQDEAANKSTVLIGFSKGCIVLNQILHEMGDLANQRGPNKEFMDSIKEMYWLDGGHDGGSNTWITDEDVLKNLVGRGIKVHVHVSPYMVEDEGRFWIKKEESEFVETVNKLNIAVTEIRHFDNEPRSIENHFKILLEF